MTEELWDIEEQWEVEEVWFPEPEELWDTKDEKRPEVQSQGPLAHRKVTVGKKAEGSVNKNTILGGHNCGTVMQVIDDGPWHRVLFEDGCLKERLGNIWI